MPINILMPALSPTMEVGNLAKWHIKEGDTVAAGDVIAEIETDKATMEVEAVDEGTVAKILVDEGAEEVRVNAVIAILAAEGEDAGAVTVPDTAPARQKAEAEPAEVKPAPSTAEPAPSTPEPPPSAPATGNGAAAPAASGVQDGRRDGEGRIFASPLARRLAREAGLDLPPHWPAAARTGGSSSVTSKRIAGPMVPAGRRRPPRRHLPPPRLPPHRPRPPAWPRRRCASCSPKVPTRPCPTTRCARSLRAG